MERDTCGATCTETAKRGHDNFAFFCMLFEYIQVVKIKFDSSKNKICIIFICLLYLFSGKDPWNPSMAVFIPSNQGVSQLFLFLQAMLLGPQKMAG